VLWLHPIHPTPGRDDGYDVTDFYGVDPRLGSLGDFAELLHQATNRASGSSSTWSSTTPPTSTRGSSRPVVAGLAVPELVRMVETEPPDRRQGMVFPASRPRPGPTTARRQVLVLPPLLRLPAGPQLRQPEVREEIKKIMAFWLQLGVSGFRMDAVPFIIELTEPGKPQSPMDFDFLTELRRHVSWRRGDAVLLAEANVEPDKLVDYFADAGGSNNRIHMLLDFMLNGRLVLALARQDPEP
jgi:maltose alpha-D-glucosyltransferase/alpha-amylase